jgi:short-subunit dehydrogenase
MATPDPTDVSSDDQAAFAERYGPWAIVAGASDGTGEAFARELAARGVDVVLVARRRTLLEEVAASLPCRTRVVELDLSSPDATAALVAATADLEIGCVIYNAGGDAHHTTFLDHDLDELHAMARRNTVTLLEVAHHYGASMVERGRGGLVVVSSFAGWAGASHAALYSATKAFDTVLAESLWAEWHDRGVDVLGLVLTAIDTPSLRRSLERHGGDLGELAPSGAVALAGLDHMGDGPTWSFGMPDPTGPSLLGGLPRRQAVELLSEGTRALRGAD